RDPVRHADDLARAGALVGEDEAPEVLASHCSRSYPETASEVEVRAQADVLDLVPVELPVGGGAAEVLEHDLDLARGQAAVDRDPRARRDVRAPVVLFLLLDVDGRDGPPPRLARRPGASELEAVLHREGVEVRGRLVEEEAAAGIQTDHVPELVGELQID